MKIIVKEEGEKDFFLWLPTRLLLNSVLASVFPLFANPYLKKYKIRLSGKSCRRFIRAFYKTRRHFGGKIELVEVKSKNGDLVKITI